RYTLLEAVETAADAAFRGIVEAEVARAHRDRQHLRNQVEVDRREEGRLFGFTHRVLVKRRVGALNPGIYHGRPGSRTYVREAAGIARRARCAVRGTRGNGLVHPAGLVVQLVGLPIRAGDGPQPPVVRRAHAEFVLLVLVLLHRVPRGARREASWLKVRVPEALVQALERARSRAEALVVIGVDAARVIRVVADLIDIAHEVAAGVDGLQVAELAVHR